MTNVKFTIARLERLRVLVEGWEKSKHISGIERKLALNHLAALYDDLLTLELAPDEVPETLPDFDLEQLSLVAHRLDEQARKVEQAAEPEYTPQAYAIAPEPTTIASIAAEQPEVRPLSVEPAPLPDSSVDVPTPASSANGAQKQLLGETLVGSKKFLYDQLGEKKEAVVLAPIGDIGKAIGINDRFLFIKELFGGDSELFRQVIANINSSGSLAAALSYIEQFGWKGDSATVQHLISLIQRRFA